MRATVAGVAFDLAVTGSTIVVSHRGRELAVRRGHVQVRADGRPKRVSVARLVLLATAGDPPADSAVPVHIDGDGANCLPGNLTWGTRAEALAAHTAGRRRGAAGSQNGAAKLSTADVDAIRASREPRPALAERYDVSVSQIGRIQRGESWR